jgi:hypothetical protein
MTKVEWLTGFAMLASCGDLSEAACDQLKIRVLDRAIRAMGGEPVRSCLIRSRIRSPAPPSPSRDAGAAALRGVQAGD